VSGASAAAVLPEGAAADMADMMKKMKEVHDAIEEDKDLKKFREDSKTFMKEEKNKPGLSLFSLYKTAADDGIFDKKKKETFKDKIAKGEYPTAKEIKALKLEIDDKTVDTLCVEAKKHANEQLKDKKSKEEVKCTDAEKKEVRKQLKGFVDYVQSSEAAMADAMAKTADEMRKFFGKKTDKEVEDMAQSDKNKLIKEKFDAYKKMVVSQAKSGSSYSKKEFENNKKFVEAIKKIDYSKLENVDKAFAAQNKAVSSNIPKPAGGSWLMYVLFAFLGIAAIGGVIFLIVCLMSKGDDNKRVRDEEYQNYNSV